MDYPSITELFGKVEAVKQHLVDDTSKQIYEMRLKYLIHRNKYELQKDILTLNQEFIRRPSKFDKIYDSLGKVDNIVIFGAGEVGRKVIFNLRNSKYKEKVAAFCDNDSKKWTAQGGGYILELPVISPDELIKNFKGSIVVVANYVHEQDIFDQLVNAGYPKERLLSYRSTYDIDFNCNYKLRDVDILFQTNEEVKSIVIFGTTLSAINALNLLRQSVYKDKKILFCDDNPNNWGKIIDGAEVISPEDLLENYSRSIVIIGDLDRRTDIYEYLIGHEYPNRRIFYPLKSLWRPSVIRGRTGQAPYFDYFEPNENEIFVDGGAFNGHTARQFAEWAVKGYEYIYSFEANPNFMSTCEDTFKEYNLKGEVIDKGLWDRDEVLHFASDLGSSSLITEAGEDSIETTALDKVLNGKRVSFIKMDIEGAEYKALIGAKETIKKWRPRLAICVYHKPEDILEIPAILIELQPDYKFALRQYGSNGSDAVLFAY